MDCAQSVPALDHCANVHGHTYKVEVVVEGPLKGGMVIDFKELREISKECMKKYDHKNLNEIFEVASCENICQALFNDIQKKLPNLQSVKLWEGAAKWAEVVTDSAAQAGAEVVK
jgi:6-pyruvoyltetrahydropterin/6-carboxytetrahydropterin synthase